MRDRRGAWSEAPTGQRMGALDGMVGPEGEGH